MLGYLLVQILLAALGCLAGFALVVLVRTVLGR